MSICKPAWRCYIALNIEVWRILKPIKSVCEFWNWREVAILWWSFQIFSVWTCISKIWWQILLLLCHRILHFRLHESIIYGLWWLRIKLLSWVVLWHIGNAFHRLIMWLSATIMRTLSTSMIGSFISRFLLLQSTSHFTWSFRYLVWPSLKPRWVKIPRRWLASYISFITLFWRPF